MITEFKTYWMIGGEKYTDWSTVQQRVLAGARAVEVSAEQQQLEAEQKAQAEQRQAAFADRSYREGIQRQYERSPEGRRAAVLAEAAKHPGGIVTPCGPIPDLEELDRHHRARTNIFNR